MKELKRAITAGDIVELDIQRDSGAIDADNAYELFYKAAKRGMPPATAKWFLDNFTFELKDAEKIVYRLSPDTPVETVVMLAKHQVLDFPGLSNLMIVLLGRLEDTDLKEVDEWMKTSQLHRDTVPTDRYPLLGSVAMLMSNGYATGYTRLSDALLQPVEGHLRKLGWFLKSYVNKFGWSAVEDLVQNWDYITFEMLQDLLAKYKENSRVRR